VKFPFNKEAYMRMNVAEKVHCYSFDTKGTDSAFEMVKAYFNSAGLSTDFDSIYEESKTFNRFLCETEGRKVSPRANETDNRKDGCDGYCCGEVCRVFG